MPQMLQKKTKNKTHLFLLVSKVIFDMILACEIIAFEQVQEIFWPMLWLIDYQYKQLIGIASGTLTNDIIYNHF